MSLESIVGAATEALRLGELVVYPTETFYAIGADALSPAAVDLMLHVKNRESGKPVGLIAADAEMAFAIAKEIPPLAKILAARFWPGPLTLVLRAQAGLHSGLVGPDGQVGVRVSSHPVAWRLSRSLGRPVTASSANRAGQPPARSVTEARAMLKDNIKLYVGDVTSTARLPSTVVGFEDGAVRVIRAGAIAADKIERVIRSKVRR
ncbi:MAG TPA: L-threonylcarbamoyladenylate synthase [Candidatus Binataceae bacterium]